MTIISIMLTQTCPPHAWAHGSTVDSYDCMKCPKSVAWNDPDHAEVAAEYIERTANLAWLIENKNSLTEEDMNAVVQILRKSLLSQRVCRP